MPVQVEPEHQTFKYMSCGLLAELKNLLGFIIGFTNLLLFYLRDCLLRHNDQYGLVMNS